MKHYHFFNGETTTEDISSGNNTHYHKLGNKNSTTNTYDENHSHLIDGRETSQPFLRDGIEANQLNENKFRVKMPGSGVTESITKDMTEQQFKKYLTRMGFTSDSEINIAKQFGRNIYQLFCDKK